MSTFIVTSVRFLFVATPARRREPVGLKRRRSRIDPDTGAYIVKRWTTWKTTNGCRWDAVPKTTWFDMMVHSAVKRNKVYFKTTSAGARSYIRRYIAVVCAALEPTASENDKAKAEAMGFKMPSQDID